MGLFFRKKAPKLHFDAPIAPEAPVGVIGDIHGCAKLLDRMISQLSEAHFLDNTLVCVGDYVDRGDDSATVLQHLNRLQAQRGAERLVCLMGNHERMMLDFLDNPRAHGERWMRHGGLQTFASFKVGMGSGVERDWDTLRDKLRSALGETLEVWLRGLPLSWQSGNLFVSHAGADPSRALGHQDPHGLLWGGENFYKAVRNDGMWVAHGHVITDNAAPILGRIPVDTGAYATGKLTAALVTTDNVGFIHT